jgi:hypothetical protein
LTVWVSVADVLLLSFASPL